MDNVHIHFQAEIPAAPDPLPGFGDAAVGVNSRYLTRNGRPWFPVSGELHYSRLPRECWETELDKMKAGGIQIVSTYVFWIHHEEIKGQFRFDGNLNVGEFIDLCRERGLEVALRVGPWAHGECRNGGHPDWIVRECGAGARHNTEPYLTYVRQYYQRLAAHLGNRRLFSIQIENELVDGTEHLRTLAQMARECGLNAPLYTATGWGYDTAGLSDLVLPTYGGYPEQPWNQNTLPSAPNSVFFFTGLRHGALIGNDLLPIQEIQEDRSTPFFTCETGPGVQCTYHRRPVISAADALANEICTLGNGCSWLGLYMYHGGTNPMGQLSTMNEDKASGYPNDCPVFSYDFQAPIGECGQLRESYFRLKTVHEFLKDFGEELAPMTPALPDLRPTGLTDMETIRCCLCSDGYRGFVFVNNHHHNHPLPEHRDVSLEIAFADAPLQVPIPVIPSGASFLFPVRMPLTETLTLEYALAQPVSRRGDVLLFEEIDGLPPLFRFSDGTAAAISGEYKIGGVTILVRRREPFRENPGTEIPFAPCGENRWLVSGLPESACTLRIDYYGNTIFVFSQGKMIADQYYYGDAFHVHKPAGVRELEIRIRPLLPEDDIYLECPRREGAGIRQVCILS